MHGKNLKYLRNLAPGKEYETFLAQDDDGTLVVVKMMDEKRAVIYRILSENASPYIANVYSVHEDSNGNRKNDLTHRRYTAITEYAGECTLERYVTQQGGRLSEKESLLFCRMLCEALRIPHEKGVIHRDIKPENIMVCQDPITKKIYIKLIDFGASKLFDPEIITDTTIVGSDGFRAPESMSSSTDARTDIYSIGCTLNYMLTGITSYLIDNSLNEGVREIIEKCTNINPRFRYQSVDELCRVLKHEMHEGLFNSIPFIREIPGFRTQTPWKMMLAFLYYPFMMFWLWAAIRGGMLDNGLFIIFFWCFLPLFICGNLGHVYRFVPKKIRENNRLFLIIRVILAIICFTIPITIP